MRNIAFVMWMIGWPLSRTIQNYVETLDSSNSLTDVEMFRVSWVLFVIWIVVGWLVYEGPPRK